MPIATFKKLKVAFECRDEPEQFVFFARSIWPIFLATFSIVACTVVGVGIWQWYLPISGVAETSAGNGSNFNRAQLEKLVESFEKRSAAFEEMMSAQ